MDISGIHEIYRSVRTRSYVGDLRVGLVVYLPIDLQVLGKIQNSRAQNRKP